MGLARSRAPSARPRALLVDDDPALCTTLRAVLEDEGVDVTEAHDGAAALASIDATRPHVVITDFEMPEMGGLELLAALSRRPTPPRVVVVTGHGLERRAVEAMRQGAYDYFTKPCDVELLVAVVRRALESAVLARENERLAGELTLSRHFAFCSPSMSRLAVLVQRVARADVSVLVTGESGTGKERLAECIVSASNRAARPFLRFGCGSVPPGLVDAELFGHERGAFTGADKTRAGLFRAAHGGTLLLDEVALLQAEAQARLLRVLQDGEVRPMGSDVTERVDVRTIATSSVDLPDAVRRGAFREDLYYRLRVVELAIPPLRERPEDVPLIIDAAVRELSGKYGSRIAIPQDVRDELARRRWPGNARELRNALEGLVALSPHGLVDGTLLPAANGGGLSVRATLKQRTDAYERGLLLEALRDTGGNRTAAAQMLGIARATLHEKLRKHGITEQGT